MRPKCNQGDNLLISSYSKSYNAFIDYGKSQAESGSCFQEFLLEITHLDASSILMPEEEDPLTQTQSIKGPYSAWSREKDFF